MVCLGDCCLFTGEGNNDEFDGEPKYSNLSKSPDTFSNRWGTCHWRGLPSEMKYALTLELCKWGLSDGQQMCFSQI